MASPIWYVVKATAGSFSGVMEISARKQKHGATEIAFLNIDSFVKQLKLGGNI